MLDCTLEEFYCGSLKKVTFDFDEVQHDSKTIARKTVHKTVQVNPGFSSATVLTFKGEGNQAPKQASANLVIRFTEQKHKHFKRSGDNLIYTHQISFADSLQMQPVKLCTLDNRSLTYCFDEFVNPQTCRCVEGEGMPLQGKKSKGDLYLRFDIAMPPKMSNEQRCAIIKALQDNAKELGL